VLSSSVEVAQSSSISCGGFDGPSTLRRIVIFRGSTTCILRVHVRLDIALQLLEDGFAQEALLVDAPKLFDASDTAVLHRVQLPEPTVPNRTLQSFSALNCSSAGSVTVRSDRGCPVRPRQHR